MPTAPASTIAVALNAATIAAGATVQGTISVANPPASGATIALSSSNPAVAAVPSTVALQAGATNASFTVSAIAAGTATIAATVNGVSGQSPSLTVTAVTIALATLTLADSSLIEGTGSTGTVTLTGAAPGGGASVALSSDGPTIVPSIVAVNAGATNATFSFSTRPGSGAASSTITASFGGVSKSAMLSIAKPTVATARFGVTGPTESDTCEMSNDGRTLSCTFNASTSSSPGTITAYEWTYSVAGTFSQTTGGAVLTNPSVDCSLMPSPPLPAGASWLPLKVTLRIRDDRGNVAEATNSGARLLPMHTCGY